MLAVGSTNYRGLRTKSTSNAFRHAVMRAHWLCSVVFNPPYSPTHLLRHRHAPRLRRFARSRILTVQASTFPVHSVTKRPSHGTWRPLVTEGW